MEEDDGDIFALIKEECELDDEWLKEKEMEEIKNDKKTSRNDK